MTDGNARWRVGVDLGGTKTEAVLLEPGGAMVARERVATPRGDYPATIEAIASLVERLEAGHRVRARVGVGTPGTVSSVTGRMKNTNSTWLLGEPLREDLVRRLGRPITLANDADCFAVSEALSGAGRGARTVFGAILGTGVGGGIVIDGQRHHGANGIAGEWGHNPLPSETPPWPERPCHCERSNCIETFLSGPGFARTYLEVTGESATAQEIAERVRCGDAGGARALDVYAGQLASALGTIINVLDPDVVVLGGGMSNVEALYELVPARFPRFVFSDSVETRLVRAELGDSSGVFGAAWL